jgi:hypothetical protein
VRFSAPRPTANLVPRLCRQPASGVPPLRVPCPAPEARRALLDWVAGVAGDEVGPSGLAQLLRQRNANGATPLITACHFCLPEVVDWLLAEGRLSYDMLIACTQKGEWPAGAPAGLEAFEGPPPAACPASAAV